MARMSFLPSNIFLVREGILVQGVRNTPAAATLRWREPVWLAGWPDKPCIWGRTYPRRLCTFQGRGMRVNPMCMDAHHHQARVSGFFIA